MFLYCVSLLAAMHITHASLDYALCIHALKELYAMSHDNKHLCAQEQPLGSMDSCAQQTYNAACMLHIALLFQQPWNCW